MTEQLPGTAEQLIGNVGQLYSIWYDDRERWARIKKPPHLVAKYRHSGSVYDALFGSLQDITEWFNSMQYDESGYSIRSKEYGEAIYQQALDRQARQSHAMKFL